ncbi:hypothetical protein [Deinococcus cellulosilyticus]|uniref:SMODS and SLOG-associating 2TM effector domain-containing protein n=1 Tax=Deinococcus cellulosilyticus (strain DSM 18568 / NBRC 106333 / KACC 11606 / 5516J-15) TaxID=1223518 RepID=A0A511N4N7_DEIC1|nr:hypothetical protein [Deinococcus cellulosilyticus]GEM47830.1 hypothetical protein DC3_34650 [Deinococcus cellulosilyticus NBRC 106333 = KACC 11606]
MTTSDRIREYLQFVQSLIGRMRRTYNTLTTVSSIAGFLATAIATYAAIKQGAIVGEGKTGWTLTCGAVSLLTLLSTLCTTMIQQSRLTERLTTAEACAGQLRAVSKGLRSNRHTEDEAREELEDIQEQHALLLRNAPVS